MVESGVGSRRREKRLQMVLAHGLAHATGAVSTWVDCAITSSRNPHRIDPSLLDTSSVSSFSRSPSPFWYPSSPKWRTDLSLDIRSALLYPPCALHILFLNLLYQRLYYPFVDSPSFLFTNHVFCNFPFRDLWLRALSLLALFQLSHSHSFGTLPPFKHSNLANINILDRALDHPALLSSHSFRTSHTILSI